MTNDMSEHDRDRIDEKDKLMFQEFPIPSYEEWRQAAEKTLKGASFEEKLLTQTYEGIVLKPMYCKEDIKGIDHVPSLPGTAPYVRGIRTFGYHEQAWEVCQEFGTGTPEEFNEAARHDLQRGQTMINMVLNSALCGDQGTRGVRITSIDDVSRAFYGINLEHTSVLIQAADVGSAVYAMLTAYAKQQGIALGKLRGCIGSDPLGTLAMKGTLTFPLKTVYDLMSHDALLARDQAPGLKTILVQGDPYHNAGANAVQELSFALATGVEYIRELQERGLLLEHITPRILFSFSIGSNFFMEVAKLRAARMLWSQVIDAFGGSTEAQKMYIHARTSDWSKTVYDPYVNILRGTVEAFAGIVGGIESLHVSPFDEVVRTADEFSRRIARNTQIILEKEAHLAKVVDPAGGSWYVESLTDSLAKQAWRLFQQVESYGGQSKALQNGFVHKQISQTADKRSVNIGRRKDKFVGATIYPNLQEQKLAKREAKGDAQSCSGRNTGEIITKVKNLGDLVQAFDAGLTIEEWVKAISPTQGVRPKIPALQLHRGAERFEALREHAEAYKERNGSYPLVYLANFGPIAQCKARADFVCGFFEVGGFVVKSSTELATAEQATQAVKSGASIVVICATDVTYPKLVPCLARALKQVKPELTIFLAGLPTTELADHYRQAGVDEFIHALSNCYDVLWNLQQQKGIT